MAASKADELFKQAYSASTVDDDPQRAIELCRQALALEPDHLWARMHLGIMLADDGGDEGDREAGSHFLAALLSLKSRKQLVEGWQEEDPLYHLGLWERDHGRPAAAAVLFLLDFFVGPTGWQDKARERLLESLREVDAELAKAVEHVLELVAK